MLSGKKNYLLKKTHKKKLIQNVKKNLNLEKYFHYLKKNYLLKKIMSLTFRLVLSVLNFFVLIQFIIYKKHNKNYMTYFKNTK